MRAIFRCLCFLMFMIFHISWWLFWNLQGFVKSWQMAVKPIWRKKMLLQSAMRCNHFPTAQKQGSNVSWYFAVGPNYLVPIKTVVFDYPHLLIGWWVAQTVLWLWRRQHLDDDIHRPLLWLRPSQTRILFQVSKANTIEFCSYGLGPNGWVRL